MEPLDPGFETQLDVDLIPQTHDIEKLTWYRYLFSQSAAQLSDAIRGKLRFLLFIYAERDGDPPRVTAAIGCELTTGRRSSNWTEGILETRCLQALDVGPITRLRCRRFPKC
jgi:hypothetical protein